MGLLSAARPRTSGNLSSVRNIRQYSGVGAGGGGGRGVAVPDCYTQDWLAPLVKKKC